MHYFILTYQHSPFGRESAYCSAGGRDLGQQTENAMTRLRDGNTARIFS